MRARKGRFSFGSKERIILLFSRLRRTYCYMCGEEHGEENFSMKKRITALLGVLLLFALTSDYIRKQRREKELLEAAMKNIK